MDEVDVKILETLKKNSRTKYVKIAQIVGLTEGAVRRRVKKMLEDGTIRKFTLETASEAEGIILIKTNSTKTREVALKTKKIAEKVFEVSGNYDIAVLIQAHTIEELNRKVDYVRTIPAVLNTNTLVKLVTP